MRLSQVARKLNVGTTTIVSHLAAQGIEVANQPNAKVTLEHFNLLSSEFAGASIDKEEASEVEIGTSYADTTVSATSEKTPPPPTSRPLHHAIASPHCPASKW